MLTKCTINQQYIKYGLNIQKKTTKKQLGQILNNLACTKHISQFQTSHLEKRSTQLPHVDKVKMVCTHKREGIIVIDKTKKTKNTTQH